jgi:hypothetical protein
MGSLKVIAKGTFKATLVALFKGLVEATVGAVTSGRVPVVKLQTLSCAIELPDMFLAPVVTVAVYTTDGDMLAVGAKVAVLPAYVTVPGTSVVPCFTENCVAVHVVGSIAALKVAEMLLLITTAVAFVMGTVDSTVGRMPGSVLFLHPITRTTVIRVINGRTFLSFIFFCFMCESIPTI